MMECWIVFDAETGTPRMQGTGPAGSMAAQWLPEDADILGVPMEAIHGAEIDFARIRDHARLQVRDAADRACAGTVTAGALQALRHAEKLAEARAWHDDADPEHFPYLMGEVAATGLSYTEAAAGIVAGAESGKPTRARIEGRRRAANLAIDAAGGNLATIKAALQIDWLAVSRGDI